MPKCKDFYWIRAAMLRVGLMSGEISPLREAVGTFSAEEKPLIEPADYRHFDKVWTLLCH